LAGAYNGNVLRAANNFVREQQAAGKTVDLYVAGKKGITSFNFQKKPIAQKIEALDIPQYAKVEELANELMHRFTEGEIDSISVVYMNFISTGVQKPDVMTLLPLAGVQEAVDHIGQQVAEKEQQVKAGVADSKRRGDDVKHEEVAHGTTTYDFSPDARTLLDEILPVAVRTVLFQTFLDATTSEHVARMVAMKSATDNAEKMGKILAMQYNRARQSQITTELMEIMGGVEAMK
jgi:F-type H+-transporting ATPase subunit gamma